MSETYGCDVLTDKAKKDTTKQRCTTCEAELIGDGI